MVASTPLRELSLDRRHGCRLLSPPPDELWLDGSEATLFDRIVSAADVSSWSDELASSARTWPELYHLATARANVVRSFALDRTMSVLEIGVGCGAVTRYLGETCGLVDAVEPTPARARVARARLRGLDNCEVHVGRLEHVPPVPAYDVVVVIGVLEYVGGGTADRSPYVAFLADIEKRLLPGGSLVLAIENRLGVKYLAGAVEDHTGRPFDSLEGYPAGSPARTFSRRELSELLGSAGLASEVLQAFPDYKLPRALLRDRLAERSQPLLRGIPSFPSPDWTVPRAALASEGALWETFADAGLAGEAGNSFVVMASKGEAAHTLWPADRLAAFWSHHDRRARYVLASEVVDAEGGLSVRRRHATGRPPSPADGLEQRALDEPVVEGTPFVTAWREADDAGRRSLGTRWADLLEQMSTGGVVPVDLVPRNMLVGERGLLPLDQEWWSTSLRRDHVLERGVLDLVEQLLRIDARGELAPRTVIEIAADVAAAAGLGDRCTFDDAFVAREAALQATVLVDRSGLGPDQRRQLLGEVLRTRLAEQVPDRDARRSLAETWTSSVAENHALLAAVAAAEEGWRESAEAAAVATARAERAEAALAESLQERDALRGSLAFRVGDRALTPVRAALPAGSARRALAARALRRGGGGAS